MAIYPRRDGMGEDPHQEIQNLRQQLRRLQITMSVALAVIGLGTLFSVGLVAFYGFRVAEGLARTEERVTRLGSDTADTAEALSRAITRQQAEITAIREAADRDLAAIQQANQKLAAIRDPRRELSALREANEALWSELASQRETLVDALNDKSPVVIPNQGRFQLGASSYRSPGAGGVLQGFVAGDEEVYRATEAASPAHLVLEVEPRGVRLGDDYRLLVRLVNRSNQGLAARQLRLDWVFGGKNTGGEVTLRTDRVPARSTSLIYELHGDWTPAHDQGNASVTATLLLADGSELQNSLRW